MRPVSLQRPNDKSDDAFRRWVESCFAEIERASYDDLSSIARDFTVLNHTATHTLDAGTATLADVTNVLCTLIRDLQNRGMKRK